MAALSPPRRLAAAAPRRGGGPAVPSPWTAGQLFPSETFFSIKTFAAAMLAYYVALRIGLPRPYWAVVTCYIVAQPLSGAVLSKAMFRLIGTVTGAAMAMLLVPNLVNAPELLSLALAGWVGLCTYVSLLDRTPRAYVALLAGYTAIIVGFPAVSTPGDIFTIASLRVQEIAIGIVCTTLIHGLILPRSVTLRLLGRVDAIIADAERWSADALALPAETPAHLDRDGRRLAVDLHELHQLATHLPYDMAGHVPRIGLLRAFQDRLALFLPLASAVEDRFGLLLTLRACPDALRDLIADARAWLATPEKGEGESDPDVVRGLIARARALEPGPADRIGWTEALQLSVLDRLQDLLAAHAVCRSLRKAIREGPAALTREARTALAGAGRLPLHRDHGLAFRGAFSTLLVVLIACAFWIATAWPDGASAVVIAGIVCALFSNLDAPMFHARRVLVGTAIAVLIAAFYSFVILPRVTDFVTLAATLAPVLLIVGDLAARPRSASLAIGIFLTLPGLLGLGDRYGGDFTVFTNAAIGQLAGTLLAVIVLGLVRAVGIEHATHRLVRAGWRDLAQRASANGVPDTSAWISQMLDRVGLLVPRLAALGLNPSEPMLDILIDTRIGISVDEMRNVQLDASQRDAVLCRTILRSVGRHFAMRRRAGRCDPDTALIRRLDLALARFGTPSPAPWRRKALLAITSLRRNLAPTVPRP